MNAGTTGDVSGPYGAAEAVVGAIPSEGGPAVVVSDGIREAFAAADHRREPTPAEEIDRAYGVLVQAFWVAAAMQAREFAKALGAARRGGDR